MARLLRDSLLDLVLVEEAAPFRVGELVVGLVLQILDVDVPDVLELIEYWFD